MLLETERIQYYEQKRNGTPRGAVVWALGVYNTLSR
jgi:hypothetical protein